MQKCSDPSPFRANNTGAAKGAQLDVINPFARFAAKYSLIAASSLTVWLYR